MKRVLIALTLLLTGWAAAMAGDDYVVLNNGSVIRGTITALNEGTSVTINSDNGQTYTYPMVSVRTISRGKAPAIPSGGGSDPNVWSYADADRGFWWTVEAGAGSTVRLSKSNRMYAEADVTVGYRFNSYARLGVGAGFRYYFNTPADLRYASIAASFPLYVNLRGNLIGDLYRSVVPFYSIDLGGAIRDGMMFRPAVGVRFGSKRSAFTLALAYTGQQMPVVANDERGGTVTNRYTSMVGLRLGWEF